MILESIKMSWQNIINNKKRSFLTILGIVIGVAAIIALINIVEGVIDEVNTQFNTLGANKLSIQAVGTPLKTGLNEKDLQNISEISGVEGLSPTLSFSIDIIHNRVYKEKVAIQGKNQVYFQKDSEAISEGRGINILDVENKSRVCVISADLAEELFLGESPLEEEIIIDGVAYKIIGIMGESQDVMSSISGSGDIILPYKTLMSVSGIGNISSLEVYTEADANKDEIIESLEGVLSSAFNYKDNSYSIVNMESLIDMIENMQRMMQIMLVGIASIALLVGGIGIMNMMLVSVTERTMEIGLRKALGAEPKSIQFQFLTEAVFLSLFGGGIGVILGLIISYLGSIAIGTAFSISLYGVVLGVSFSAAIGIVFGLAPARKASRLNPIDALRTI